MMGELRESGGGNPKAETRRPKEGRNPKAEDRGRVVSVGVGLSAGLALGSGSG